MLISLRIRPYVSTLIVILATIMFLFLGHARCKIWISLYTNSRYKSKVQEGTMNSNQLFEYNISVSLAKSTIT